MIIFNKSRKIAINILCKIRSFSRCSKDDEWKVCKNGTRESCWCFMMQGLISDLHDCIYDWLYFETASVRYKKNRCLFMIQTKGCIRECCIKVHWKNVQKNHTQDLKITPSVKYKSKAACTVQIQLYLN